MAQECGLLDRFADGELDPAAAEQFRAHLGSCGRCRRRLSGRMQLAMAAFLLAEEKQGAATPPGRPRRRAVRVVAIVAGGLLAAAGIVLGLRWSRPPVAGDPDLAALAAAAPTRATEARLARAELGAHRPYDVARGAPAAGSTGGLTLQALARIDRRGDAHALAVAWLLAGDPSRAAAALDGLPGGPAVDNDRAVIALGRRDPEAALGLLERAAHDRPEDPRIQFNQALAARDLALPWLAGERLRRVAAHGEPGWAAEAASRAATLERAAAEARAGWREARRVGDAMVRGGPPVDDAVARSRPGITRLYLYHAVRAAPTAARVTALRPLAERLDPDGHLRRLVDRVAASDFRVRAPLAAEYLALYSGTTFDSPRLERLLAAAAKSGHGDIAVGALILGDLLPQRLQTLRAVSDPADPWPRFTVEQEAARGEIARGDLLAAERRLQRAIAECHPTGVEYRCVYLEHELAQLYGRIMHRVVEARAVALVGWAHARQAGEWGSEALLLQDLSLAARFDRRFALARALLAELRLRDVGHCGVENYAALEGAYVAFDEARYDEARAQLAAIRDCGGRPDLALAELLIDLRPHGGSAAELARAEGLASMVAADPKTPPGDRALARLFSAQGALLRGAGDGIAQVEAAIRDAERLPADNAQGKKARSFGYALLAHAAAQRGDFPAAIEFLARDTRVEAPRRCAVGASLRRDELALILVGPTGAVSGRYEAHLDPAAEVAALIRSQAAPLRGCEIVDVIARWPLHGNPKLLPPEMAWRFRVAAGGAIAPPEGKGPPRRLVVGSVEPPAWLGLPTLSPPEVEPPPTVTLLGAAATPARVLGELATATEVEIHAHGFLDLGVSEVSFLALSPEPGGRYALTARDVRNTRLRGAPLVVLGACHAAAPASDRHEPWSLAAAFLAAGARAVIASPAALSDREAGPFLRQVREGIRRGQPIAIALRDARSAWASRGEAPATVGEIVLFE